MSLLIRLRYYLECIIDMIKLKNIVKTYDTPNGSVHALKDINLEIKRGEIYGIIGLSGAGKSTLVRCINMLERPTSGNVIVNGKDLTTMTESQLREARKDIGMIFQHFNLLSTSTVYDNIAFPLKLAGKSKEEIKQIAIDGAKLLKDLTEQAGANYRFEYSPESFTGTEPEFALEVCNAVLDVWQPTSDRKAIINLPATVQMSMPHVYASQIAYISQNLKYRENVVLSLHPHNDRGTGVADSEMGLLAGADRIEGTLFGNGERTGNADIITIAMNMFALGVDPKLDFSNMPEIIEMYERVTRMHVYERQPYAGKLVFAAFSGSHQDAIAKGMKWREENDEPHWTVPYLLIDPQDVGRQYDADVIRINSQSGKGGVAYVMEQKYGLNMPKKMREDFGYCVKGVSDHKHKELMPEEIYQIFQDNYVNVEEPYKLIDFVLNKQADGTFKGNVHLMEHGHEVVVETQGNGRFDAASNAIQKEFGIKYDNLIYSEHAMEIGATSRAMAYVGITAENGKTYWGAGMDTDIITASIKALISAVNRMD